LLVNSIWLETLIKRLIHMFNKQFRMNSSITQKILTKRQNRSRKLELVKTIDLEQFAAFYENFAKRIYHYIYFRMVDEQKAEDLTSQVFLKAWEKKDYYKRTGAPFITWIYTIARNTVIDDYRTSKQTVALEDGIRLESDQPNPAEECELHCESELLHAAIQSLTEEQQQVVTLKYMDGLTTEEIAARLGKRTGTVRALQMRALRTLSRQLDII
jgi:RNA polymerase sigma-70 factor (ECF subfamily)